MDFVGAGSSEGGTAPALPLPSSATEPAPSILFPSGKLCPKPWGLEKYLRRTSSCIKTAPSQRCREHSPEFPKHGPLYVINCPIRCSSPGQTQGKALLGSPIPSTQLPDTLPCVGSVPKSIPTPGNTHMGRKNKGCAALCRQPRASKQLHFIPKCTEPRMDHLEHPHLQIQQNEAKQCCLLLILKQAEQGDLSSPGSAVPGSPAGIAPRPRRSLHKLPCPAATGKGCIFFPLKKILNPLFRQEKKKPKTQLRSRQIF